MFEPVRTRRTFEEAAEQIAHKVRTGELRVGDKLPGERTLAVQMEISRPTLREAVRILVEAGLLEVRRGPGGGMFVAADVVPVELVREKSTMRVGEVAAVLEARRLVEPRVALDDRRRRTVTVDGQRLYEVARPPDRERHRLTLRPDPGVAAFSFTFG